MLPRLEPGPDLLRLAAAQDGVVSTEQAVGLGLSAQALYRLARTGQWQRLDRSVYLSHSAAPTWRAQAWAGVLLGGDRARLGGTAAGHLHGLVEQPPTPITVLVPEHQVTRSRSSWLFHRECAGFRDARSPGTPPRTTVEDTVLDLCDDGSAAAAVGWVTSAVQSRRTSVASLSLALQRRSRARNRRLLQELLGDVAAGAESPLEVRYLRDVERAHGLPTGDRQNRSRLPFRRDVVYLGFGVVVELDGRLGHTGMGRFRDMQRDNRTALNGEVTLRYGFGDVAESSCSVARQVATVLIARGWTGTPTPCPCCRLAFEHMV